MPHSVYNETVLTCRVCNTHQECMEFAKAAGYSRPLRRLSAGERQLVTDVHRYGIAGQHLSFAHEVKPWTHLSFATSRVSVDIVVFEGPPTVDMRRALMVFFDGQQHRPWKAENAKQCKIDKLASAEAAAAGYCVLRLSYKDAGFKMDVLDAAWRARTPAGWTRVSSHWNYGAHRRFCHVDGAHP